MNAALYATIPIITLLFTCPSGVNASYTLTVELKSYENPSHMRAQSNDCCDGNCSNPCDNRFRFCFTDDPDNANSAGVLLTRPEEAVIGCQFATDVISMDNDDITFPSSKTLGGNAENPLEFNGDIWPGEGYLLVLVFDFDRNTVDDFVEAVIVRIEPPSLGRYTDVEEFEGYFDYGMLRLRYRVDCDNNFFGEDCSAFCVGRNDADGHYRCNRHGERVCLNGYRNTSSDCTECVPATGCSPVGGYCSQPGNCFCLPGFTGSNCTEALPLDVSPMQCSTPAPDSTADSQPMVVYVLGALVGVLTLILVAVVAVVILLAVYNRRKGKLTQPDERSSRGYYMNDNMGPVQTTSTAGAVNAAMNDRDNESEASSRQYATVNSNERIAFDHIPHNVIESRSNSYSSSSSALPSPQNDVPNSSLRPNVAYGIDANKRGRGERGGMINGKRAPMRPPPRPPH